MNIPELAIMVVTSYEEQVLAFREINVVIRFPLAPVFNSSDLDPLYDEITALGYVVNYFEYRPYDKILYVEITGKSLCNT